MDTRLTQPGASAVIYGGVDATVVRFEGVAQALAQPGTDAESARAQARASAAAVSVHAVGDTSEA